MSEFSANIPPPLNLTPYLVKAEGQYHAGGSFSDVYRCRYHDNGLETEVAVKALRFRCLIDGDASDKTSKMLRRELGIWRRLDHINIVPFLGIASGFGMCGAMSLVSLWMPNNSLQTFLEKHDDKLGLDHRVQFLLDIANGLRYIHSIPIIHGDLNCNNVLVDADYNARLADFGYSSLVGNIPEALGYLERSTTRPGSLRYAAPEQVNPEGDSIRIAKSDVYSFGCIGLQGGLFRTVDASVLTLLQVLSGKQPWSEVREALAVLPKLLTGRNPGRPASRKIDESHWDFLQRCWSSVDKRPSVESIIPTIQGFLHCLPQSRPLCDILGSQSSQVDSLMIASSPSLDETVAEGARDVLIDNQDRPDDVGSQGESYAAPSESHLLPKDNSAKRIAPKKDPQPEPKTLSGDKSTGRRTKNNDFKPESNTYSVDHSSRRIGNYYKPDPRDLIILVMGPSGSGKSNFIDTATGNTERHEAGLLRSSTDVIIYPVMDQGARIVLVDTPGFDDTYQPDSEILRVIAGWLTQKYPDGGTLSIAGIIYLHRITGNRMSGSVYKNLQMFGRLCGNLSLRRARLVTTMWDKVKDEKMAESREKQLTSEFWRKLIMEGAVARRFDNTERCAWNIIRDLASMGNDGDMLLIQEELVGQHKRLNETEAAKVLQSHFQQLLVMQKKTLKALADEAKMQDDPALTERLQEEYDRINAQLQKTFDEMGEMKIPFLRRLTLQLFGPRSRAQAIKLDDL